MKDLPEFPRPLTESDAIEAVLDKLARAGVSAAQLSETIARHVPVDLDLLRERMESHPFYGKRTR